MHGRVDTKPTFYESAEVALKVEHVMITNMQGVDRMDVLEQKCKNKTITNEVA